MFPRIRLSIGLKIAALTVVLCAGAAIVSMLLARIPGRNITDQDVLREAVADWKRSGEPGFGPDYQIFEQQAAQGYYDDAAATAHLFKRPDDVRWSVVELAKTRAENGDAHGAKAMIRRLVGSDLGDRALKTIASVQAANGDLPGAFETDPIRRDSDDLLLVFANRQIANGDFDGALETAERMDRKSADQIFYGVGDALRIRGEQNRVSQLASHMSNSEMAALFGQLAQFTPSHCVEVHIVQADPCGIAYHEASIGDFAAADLEIEKNKCSYISFIAASQYATDPVGAEHLLRSHADSHDLISGLNQFALIAAKNGHIAEALRFLDDVQSLTNSANSKNAVLAPAHNLNAVHEIARCWTIKDGPNKVLKWAHSRPHIDERTWALIGIAEALGHARPRS
ncbi:MAG: hypothetical protein WB919_20145 [Candidatus Sulfotelmatobacter sp.]